MDFRQYMGKDIIAWLSYDEYYEETYGGTNTKCYLYPRVLIKEQNYFYIDPHDFPQYGSIVINIRGGETAEDLYKRVGPLVKVIINNEPYINTNANNYYSLKYNTQFGKTNSEIWIEPLSSKVFYQIIDVNSNITTLQDERSIPEPNYDIRTTQIVLRCEDKIYGPFEYDIKEGTVYIHGVKNYQYMVGEYNSVDYNDELLVINDKNDNEAVILLPKSVLPSPEDVEIRFDWISEDALIDGFVNSLRDHFNYSRDQVRQLKEMANQLSGSDDNVFFSEERVARIQSVLSNIVNKDDSAQAIIQFALSDETTKETLVREVVTNHFDQIQNKITEYVTVQEHLAELKSEESSLERHIQELQATEQGAKQSTNEVDQNRINELTQKNDELQKELYRLSEKAAIQKEIEELIEERDKKRIERDHAKDAYMDQMRDNIKLEEQFNSTLADFNDRAKTTARVLESKLLEKILRGVGEEPITTSVAPFDFSILHEGPMDYSDIINRVTSFIVTKAHREVTPNDVANYLICISQGFITTFAGEPGTGKTSLCNILAKSLGLVVDTPQKRFIDISVERGWASHKDFIGYYNPLTKALEKSNKEVFNAFEQMDTELECDQSAIAPFIILLDEANLSPLEHYWAAFLRNCDFSSVSNRTIALGGNKSFSLPEHLRFLATVNFDHTTEELSPRFLDRSWVIMLEPSRIDDELDEEIENYEDMVSFGSLKAAFSVRDDDRIDESIQTKWSSIQKLFKDHSLQIMPRNLKMVRNYCSVGCRCMEQDTPTIRLAPLDYAFSQKILPTINGTGENYRLLIEDLMKECTPQNMPISARHLERMKRIAENNMGFYQFFSH